MSHLSSTSSAPLFYSTPNERNQNALRMTVMLNASGGLTEAVDFTNARSRNVGPRGAVQVELPHEFELRAQL